MWQQSDKYKGKYRIPSNRLRGYDYGANGCYFVTICTKNKEHYFGEILNGELQPSEIGEIAQSEWWKTKELRLDMNLILDEFIVMPNHIHGIIVIGENEHNTQCADEIQCGNAIGRDALCGNAIGRDALQCVSTDMQCTEQYKNKFGAQSKNLSSIIRGYKTAVTTYARRNNIVFAWQERFHDHIIRNHEALVNIRGYIFNNPSNWNEDELND